MDIEEFDIPIWDKNEQIKLGLCSECGKRKAKFQCDYITGKTFDLYGKGVIKESTCNVYLCEKCTNKLNKKDYCKKHYEEIKKEIRGLGRMSKEEKIKILAEKLNNILPLLDGFMNSLNEEDIKLLQESKEVLQDKISINNSALVLINACGGDYDDTEDRMKIKTLDCLIDLLKTREEYKKELIKKQKENENKEEVLKLFGLMRM